MPGADSPQELMKRERSIRISTSNNIVWGDDNEKLAHIALVTVIQFIACYLADWGVPKQFLSCALLYYGRDCLLVIFSNTKKTACVG